MTLAIDPLRLRILANLSASMLLLLLVVLLVAAAAALWFAGKGLAIARRELAVWGPYLLAKTRSAAAGVEEEVEESVLRPQIEVISRLKGLRAGFNALLHPTVRGR
jgi:hypothetical protein